MRTIILILLLCSTASALDYPIVYVRTPRQGDGSDPSHVNVLLPEVADPIRFHAGTDLIVRQLDGTESVLVAGGAGQAIDPYPSFDAAWVFYAYFPDATKSDIWKVNVGTGEKVQLTFQEKTPHTGWVQNIANVGVYNLGPCPLPGGRLAFTSNRNLLRPVKNFTKTCQQLHVMGEDGKNVEQTGYLNLGSALHPTVLKNGKIMWSSFEVQGRRDPRLWGLWDSYPDGRNWGPLMSAFSPDRAFHFHTQKTDGSIVATNYYNAFNNGLGELLQFTPGQGFENPNGALNPKQSQTFVSGGFPFQPAGMTNLAPWSHGTDLSNAAGKPGHPAGAPGNKLLVTYSPGPANTKMFPTNKPYFDHGVYEMSGVTAGPAEMTLVVNNPAYNENQPRALVTYQAIYGIAEPATIAHVPHDSGHPLLPKGTPFALIGTSGVYARETHGANSLRGIGISNMKWQGGDSTDATTPFANSLIHSMRILVQEPTSNLYIHRDFESVGNERLRLLGEIPLRKFNGMGQPILDAAGDPDTSFAALIPADVSFTFQLADSDGVALTTSQTWHQLRPGEVRLDCGGCHAHHQGGIAFEGTEASKPGYSIAQLTAAPTVVEYFRDIEPIVARSCQPCHSGATPPNGFTINHLVGVHNDEGNPTKSQVKGYQARGSLLYTKIKDGLMPPAGSGVPGVSAAELKLIAQWIDLGCAINKQEPAYAPPHTMSTHRNGIFKDDAKPTLAVESPPLKAPAAVELLRFGDFDFSGVTSRSVKANFATNGRAANAELSDLFTTASSVHSLALSAPVGSGQVTFVVTDGAGHKQTVVRSFVTEAGPPPPPPPPPDCAAQLAALQAQFAALQAQHVADIAAKDAQIAALQTQIAALQAKINAAIQGLQAP